MKEKKLVARDFNNKVIWIESKDDLSPISNEKWYSIKDLKIGSFYNNEGE